MKTYTQHPLSSCFPSMPPDEFQVLLDSISVIGLQNPITIFDGQVIDGWHRYRACRELGVECLMEELVDMDPRDFVLAQNKARRHITASQLAIATAAVYQHQWSSRGANQHTSIRLEGGPSKTNSDIAAVAGVAVRSIERAKAVQANGCPEVIEAVKSGAIGLVKAEAISRLPRDQQTQAIHKPMAPPSKPAPQAPKEYGTDGAPADDGPDEQELQANALAAKEEEKYLQGLLDADDKMLFLHNENKKLIAEVAQLKVSRNGYMTELAEYKKITAKVQRQNDRLARQN